MSLQYLKSCIDDRPAQGVFRVHKNIYSDPEIFRWEQEFIFSRCWGYLAHESQLKKAHDWLATHIGQTPVLVTRDGSGAIHAFINACRHKGAMLTRARAGNRKFHTCAYHGWAFASDGTNVDIKDMAQGLYSEAFLEEGHDLVPLAGVGVYKGLVFGCVREPAVGFDDFLGEIKFFIDLAMDQGEHGMEVIPGRVDFTYDANWKLQIDNGMDPYHLSSTHSSFLAVMARRSAGQGHQEARQFDWKKRFQQVGGTFEFKHGNAAYWLDQAEVDKRPIYPDIENIARRVGKSRADWMLKLRNITLFPNFQIADSTSLLMRTFRPVAVDRTEVRYFCLGPVGEAPERRAWRLRQFEDFFNLSGLATPDDTVIYESCQRGFAADGLAYLQGHSRGQAERRVGGNPVAEMLGIEPEASFEGEFMAQPELLFQPAYREWARLMASGFEQREQR